MDEFNQLKTMDDYRIAMVIINSIIDLFATLVPLLLSKCNENKNTKISAICSTVVIGFKTIIDVIFTVFVL